MTLREALESGAQSAVSWIVVGFLGGIGWLIRRVFTNQRQIDAMKNALSSRDAERDRDREEMRASFARIEGAQKEMRDDIKSLFQRHFDA